MPSVDERSEGKEGMRLSMGKNYKRNYITNFIIRFDYNEIDEKTLEKVQEEFEKKYKFVINETKMMEQGKIKVDFATKESSIETESVKKEFCLFNIDRTERVKFSVNTFVFETIKYVSYDNIKDRIESFINIISKNNKNDELFNRIGMRYINNIEMPYKNKEEILNWKDYISTKIWDTTNYSKENRKILQKILVQEFKSKEAENNIMFRLQSGVPNPNKPAELVKKNFLIDIDGFTMNVERMNDALDKLQSIHDEESEIFDDCIDSKLKRIMNGEEIDE